MKEKIITGYHFTGEKLRNGDPLPKPGIWLKHPGDVVPCREGLHMSQHPFDALQYAPGNLLHKVQLKGNLASHGNPIDKWAGSQRRIQKTINAESLLRDFARWNALQVAHLWDCPKIVKEYLESGNKSLRAAAWAAADAAAWAAAEAAAWAEAGAAARVTAEAAAEAEAGAVAWAEAGAAARAAFAEKYKSKFKKMVIEAFK